MGGQPLSLAIVMVDLHRGRAALSGLSRKTRTKNEVYLYTFYMVVGIAGLAKGLIGALQPGMIILVYLLDQPRVAAARRRGAGPRPAHRRPASSRPGTTACWCASARSFWNELFGTEQLRRLTIGEQAQAKGTFEYYVSQIGYGLFPWIAFLPAALVARLRPHAARRSAAGPRAALRHGLARGRAWRSSR